MAKAAITMDQMIAHHHELAELLELARSAPQPMAEARKDARRMVERLAAEWGTDLAMVWLSRPNGWLDTARAMLTPGMQNLTPLAPPVFLAKVAPKLFEEFLTAELAPVYETLPAPLTAEQRAARLAELTTEHEINQVAMAAAWWKLADVGLPAPPPEELEPWALLGVERQAA